MIRTLHFIACFAAAILTECVLGNFHIAFPFAACVLYFAGRKLPLPALAAVGVLAGLFFDLLYFHPFPCDLCLFAVALPAAQLLEKKMNSLALPLRLIFPGFVLGAIVHGGNILLAPGSRIARLFTFGTLLTILFCSLLLLFLQLLSGTPGKKSAAPREEKKKTVRKKAGKKKTDTSGTERKKKA